MFCLCHFVHDFLENGSCFLITCLCLRQVLLLHSIFKLQTKWTKNQKGVYQKAKIWYIYTSSRLCCSNSSKNIVRLGERCVSDALKVMHFWSIRLDATTFLKGPSDTTSYLCCLNSSEMLMTIRCVWSPPKVMNL